MPYKKGQKWVAQVRKEGTQKNKRFKTKKEALAWEAEMRQKPTNDWQEKIDTICLGDWAQVYMDYAQTKFVPKTYDEKQAVFRRFFREFKPAKSVSELNRAKVLSYIIKQNKKRSGYGANKDRKNLLAAWNWGIKYMDPALPSPNPFLVEKMPEVRHPRYIPPEEDFWKVYGVAEEGQDQIMLLTFLHLAARRGEIFRLTWADIDFGNSRARLGTRKRMDGTLEYDWLPMTQELRQKLRWWWENRPIKDSPFVFVCTEKKPFCKEHYGEPFKERSKFIRRLCDEAKIKRFGFHAIRHLSASILFNLGYEVAVIQTILRHKSPNTTERYLKSLGLEKVRGALEDLSKRKGKILKFKTCQTNVEKNKKPSGEPSTPPTASSKIRLVK